MRAQATDAAAGAADDGPRTTARREEWAVPHMPDEAYGCDVGTIYYGSSAVPIHIEDRALAHLKVVIATKLRRSESFTLSWRHPDDQPRGRSTIWLHPSIPLRFVFDEPEPPELSREWLEELASSANSSGGISLVAEQVVGTGPIEVQVGGPASTQTGAVDLSVGTLAVDEVSIRKLEVAGRDATAADAGRAGAAPGKPADLVRSEQDG